MLNDRAHSVAERLLPNGKLISGEWCVGSINGEAGQSLKVCVKGAKIGVWADFADGNGGDLIELWCKVCSISVGEALTEIKQFLGVKDPDFQQDLKKNYTIPKRVQSKKPVAKMHDYFCNERMLPGKVLDVYRIGEQGENAYFPFIKNDVVHLIKKYHLKNHI